MKKIILNESDFKFIKKDEPYQDFWFKVSGESKENLTRSCMETGMIEVTEVVIKEDGYTDICVGETYGEGNCMISGEFWYEKSDPAITHWMSLPKLQKIE